MSMKGDLPGLSNFCPGAIGSCQYSTLRSGGGSVFALGALLGAWLAAGADNVGAVDPRTPIQWPTTPPTINANATEPTHRTLRFMASLRKRGRDSVTRQAEN